MDLFRFLRRPIRATLPQPARPAQPARESPLEDAPYPGPAAGAAPAPPPTPVPTPAPTPDGVRRLLFDAVASGDESRLRALCDEHEDVITEHSEAWLEVPPQFRASPHLADWYRNGLRAISQYCAERSAQQRLSDGITRLLDGQPDAVG